MSVPSNAILRIVGQLLLPESVIAQNVFYMLFANDGSSNDDLDVIDDLVDWLDDIYGAIANSIDTDVTPSTVYVYIYDAVDDDWDEVGVGTLTFSPNAAQEMLPHGVAAIISAKTVDPDVRGTKYFAGFTEAGQDAGNWSAGPLTQLAAAGSQWVTDHIGAATGSTFNPGVWSVAQTAFKAMSGTVIVNTVAGYQRRRKPRIGI